MQISFCEYSSVATVSPEQFLNKEEYLRWSKLPQKKKMSSLIGKVTAKRATQALWEKHCGAILPYHTINIRHTSAGMPRIHTYPILLSISHTDDCGIALVALDKPHLRIGIDIERIRTFNQKFIDGFLTKNEQSWCEEKSADEKKRRQTLSWSYKEAFLKALGTGLREHPKTVEISPITSAKVFLSCNGYRGEGREITLPGKWGNYVATVVEIYPFTKKESLYQ